MSASASKLTTLEIHCLNALTDDYENAKSIKADIDRVLNQAVNAKELEDCVAQLVGKGLAVAYDFDPIRSKYAVADLRRSNISEQWFGLTDRGREELNRNWVDK